MLLPKSLHTGLGPIPDFGWHGILVVSHSGMLAWSPASGPPRWMGHRKITKSPAPRMRQLGSGLPITGSLNGVRGGAVHQPDRAQFNNFRAGVSRGPVNPDQVRRADAEEPFYRQGLPDQCRAGGRECSPGGGVG